jgi:hypothetical protein
MKSQTCVNIIDSQTESQRDEINAQLMWAGCLFSERSASTSYSSSAIDMCITFHTLPEAKKFNMYMYLVSKIGVVTPDMLKVVEDNFALMQMLKKMKGKSQQEIVLLKKMEKEFQDMYNSYLQTYQAQLDRLRLTPLLPLATRNAAKPDRPLLVWWLPENDSLQHGQGIIQLFSTALPDPNWLSLFDAESIRSFANLTDFNQLQSAAKEKAVLCAPLFQYPEPLNLTSQQVQIVRNELATVAWPLMDALTQLGTDIQKISFEQNNFSTLVALVTEKTDPLKLKVQQSVHSNQYLNGLKNETTKTCRLWIAISPLTMLFDVYHQQGLIDLSSLSYSKEQAAQNKDLKSARLFLFLEVIDNA